MKKISIVVFVLLLSMFAFADETCDESLLEAKQEFRNGRYQKAKALFQYVQGECGANYGSAAAWVQKCNDALNSGSNKTTTTTTRTGSSSTSVSTWLSVETTTWSAQGSGETKIISVSCSSNTSWLVSTKPDWITYSKYSGYVKLTCPENPYSSSRTGTVVIKTADGKQSKSISVTQNGKSTNNQSTPSSGTATLSVSLDYIYASSYGETRTITVTSNRSWEIQYPTSNMYSVTRSGNTLTVKVNENTTSSSREDFFNVKTTDGSKTVKVKISQGARNSSSTNNYRTSSSYQSPYRKYQNNQGVFEVTWFGIGMGIGTEVAYTPSAFKLRWGPVQLSPGEFSVGYDFIKEDLTANYQPSLDFVIPVASNHAVYAGAGPVVDMLKGQTWFKVEAGWHLHWGASSSSNFYARYDGAFVVGVSIQWSTGW